MKISNLTKRIVSGTLFLVISLSAHGSAKFDGGRIGLTAGGDFGKARAQTIGSASSLPNISVSNATDLGFNGVLGGIFAGYGKMLNGIYLGCESGAEIYSSTSDNSNNTLAGAQARTLLSIKKQHAFSADLKLGKEVTNNLLLYIKGGVAWINYRLFSTVIINGATEISGTARNNKGLAQLTAGIGVEHVIMPLSPQIDFIGGIEYQHSFARSMNVSLNSSTFNGTTKFKSSLNILKIKLSARF